MPSKTIAVGYPDFNLHTLGWKAFQDICITVLQNQLGQAVQLFSPVHDGGRDGAFEGDWTPSEGLNLTGSTIVQCKFTNKASANLTKSAFSDEIAKARLLWEAQSRQNYVLITNLRVTGAFEASMRESFKEFGCDHFHAFGVEWLSSAIQQSPKLRMLVPRLYGLGDLSQILDERWYDQTEALLEAERENLSKFVPTTAYKQAVKALNENGFVLLLGEPAVGKTAIAGTLTLASGDAWQCKPLKLEHAHQLRERWNPHERQLLWIDDAFGALQYESSRAHEWNAVLPTLEAALKQGSKVILTSRDYVYRRARPNLKTGTFPLLNESQVVVDVSELSSDEREQILYNHVRMGNQSVDWRNQFKEHFDLVAQHPDFRPEIARRLGNKAFTKNLGINPAEIGNFVENPEAFLRDTIDGISDDDRTSLAAILLRGGALHSSVEFQEDEVKILARMGGTTAGITANLTSLNGSFVSFVTGEIPIWAFKHPTIGDAFIGLIADNPELLDMYIHGASIEKLMSQVTCGDVGLENSRLIVPKSRFDLVISRINAPPPEELPGWEARWYRERRKIHFLATRCSKEFLEQYIRATPPFWDRILRFGSYLSAIAEFDLLVTLAEYDLLSTSRREAIVQQVKHLAVHTPDSDFLSAFRIRRFFSDAEIEDIMDHVRDHLLPALDDTVQFFKSNYASGEDPNSHYGALVDALEAYETYFRDLGESTKSLWGIIAEVNEHIDDS
ncbi:MAG: hypothetical protein O2826_05075, partial [Chloroflexi bacterium]|nr:hypothetical protein [Chloroflexota bacterium]